jgi:hypothetical protein
VVLSKSTGTTLPYIHETRPLENLTVAQLAKKFTPFKEPESPLPCSQKKKKKKKTQ